MANRDPVISQAPPGPHDQTMPEELSSRHLRARLIQLAALVLAVGIVVWLLPGLGSLRHRFDHASAGWLIAAGVAELLSTFSYVVIFRPVFCPRMSWRTSYKIGMAEQAANSLLPAGGAGGLALGAWALSRGGISADHIARRTVAFFLLTSLANVGTLVVFAAAFAVGLLSGDRAPAFTYAFGAAGLAGIVVTLALPALLSRTGAASKPVPADAGRLRKLVHRGVRSLDEGVRDAVALLRRRNPEVLSGSFGYMAFDIVALGCCFRAFGYAPGVGVLVVAYMIGQLGGLIPIPGGIGGIEGGLIGTFAIYHVPVAASAAAVLAYRAFQLWVPAALGSVAFFQLRRLLSTQAEPAIMCAPLAAPLA